MASKKPTVKRVPKEPESAVEEPRDLPDLSVSVPKDFVDSDIADQGTTLGVREENPAVTDPGSTLDS